MMPAINPILADGIDLPIALVAGFVVVAPLLLFEVVVEGLVLKKIWSIPFRNLCRLTLIANCLSLLAGIPIKILNACLYSFLLPGDLPGFFTWYPVAVAAGALIYFATTIIVESAYAFRWLSRKGYKIAPGRIWKGMFLANLASYAVVAPLYFYITRPPPREVNEFTKNVNWSSHQGAKLIFVAGTDESLHSAQLGSVTTETILPKTVKDDYLLSPDLELCLFRRTNDVIYLYRRTPAQCKFVMQSDYHFQMVWAAFSPSGRYVAYADELNNTLELLDLETGQTVDQPLIKQMPWEGSVAWSTNESIFYIGLGGNEIIQCVIRPTGTSLSQILTQTNLVQTNGLNLLKCYGQLRNGGYGAMFDDESSSCNHDSSGGFIVNTVPSLGSGLEVYSTTNRRADIEILAANRPLLFPRFDFGDVAFLDRNECLFEASGYIYLLDIGNKRVGTVMAGGNFILLTPRYQKHL